MKRENSNKAVALIVGVTGMVGVSLTEALKNPTAPGGPWKVYGAARRPLPPWFPSSLLDHFITFDATKAENTLENLSPISSEITHVFWVALQVREDEEANVSLNTTMLKNVLNALLERSSKPPTLRHVTIQTGTKHYMDPIFDPAQSPQFIPHETPFQEDYPRLPFPNFYYSLEDLVASYSELFSFSYSIHRSSIIIGASSRSLYNALLTLSIYATICKHEGLPLLFPGNQYSWDHFGDLSDTRVLTDQQIWAAVTPDAKNEAFNCTNGDVFTWKRFWKVLCECFDVKYVPFGENDELFDSVEFMKDKGGVWDDIVEKYGLEKTKLEEITCFDAAQLVLRFEFQHVCSMNKSRELGFFGYANTLKSIGMWVERLRKMKIIP